MAFNQTDTKQIEKIVRDEIKSFLGSSTIKQYEEKLMTMIAKDIKRGKLEGEVKDIVIKIFREFYQYMWTQRGHWEPRLKNS
jgi:hypothetical protein